MPSTSRSKKGLRSQLPVTIKPQALASFQEGNRMLLELPPSFDAEGDAGSGLNLSVTVSER